MPERIEEYELTFKLPVSGIPCSNMPHFLPEKNKMDSQAHRMLQECLRFLLAGEIQASQSERKNPAESHP